MLHADEGSLFSYGGGASPLNLSFGVFASVDAAFALDYSSLPFDS